MENGLFRGEHRSSRVHYTPSQKPVDPNYHQIRQRGVRGGIGRHPDFHITEFLLKQHRRIEEILRDMPLSLQAEENEIGKVAYPPLAVSPYNTHARINCTALTPIGEYQNYSIPEIGRKIKQEELQDEPGSILGDVFIVNNRTFIRPYSDEVEIRYRVFNRKSPKGNSVFHTIELHLDSVPRTDIFDF